MGTIRSHPRDQNVGTAVEQCGSNADDFLIRLAESEDDLGHTVPQGPMMIDLSKTEVFIRHVANLGKRLFDIDSAFPQLFKQGAELSFIHEFSAYHPGHVTQPSACPPTPRRTAFSLSDDVTQTLVCPLYERSDFLLSTTTGLTGV